MESRVRLEVANAPRGRFSQPRNFVVRPVGIEPTTLSLEDTPEANDINKDSV